MAKQILFVFEGVKTELNIVNNLLQFFIQDENDRVISASYGHTIEKLYDDMHADDGLDLLGIIQEKLEKRQKLSEQEQALLKLEDSQDISDIYLFFDLDPHTSNASPTKVRSMLELFADSTDNGMLLLSYPMVEAIRHIRSERPEYLLHSTTDLTRYKKFTTNPLELDQRFHNWGIFDLETWWHIILVNLHRANQLVTGMLSLPDQVHQQLDIFDAQQEKHIPHHQVAVLSAFPLMLHEFYGQRLFEGLNPPVKPCE